jgi:hypothetical protein
MRWCVKMHSVVDDWSNTEHTGYDSNLTNEKDVVSLHPYKAGNGDLAPTKEDRKDSVTILS